MINSPASAPASASALAIASPSAPQLALRGVSKEYRTPAGAFTALDDVTLSICAGEFVAIMGESGSGKSTLLSLMAGIDRPTRGEVIVAGTSVHTLAEHQLSAWRGKAVGIVFQFFQLLPTLTAVENVMLPMDFCATYAPRERRPRAMSLLERLGVASQADKLPSTLSGGQQQRVAVARALANDPAVLLADEPTGNLDSQTSAAMLESFSGLAQDGLTIVMVTHEQRVLRHATRSLMLRDGRLVGEGELLNA